MIGGGAPPTPGRYLFLDHLRFLGVIFMIQGHVFDAVLSPTVKALPLYFLHDFFHGFVAPVFFFASGAAFGVSTIRKWQAHAVWGATPARRVAKYLGLLAIGYALHLPYFSLRGIIVKASREQITTLLQVDALQSIAVTLLLLQLSVLVFKRKDIFVRVVAVCAVFVVFATPIAWSLPAGERLPAWLGAYLNASHGSWFPLFPWSAYILCGVVFGYCFVTARDPHHAASRIRANLVLSGGVVLLATVMMWLPFTIYPPHDIWRSDPAVFLIRAGAVSLAASAMFLAEYATPVTPGVPLIVGRESLFVYLVHLQVVYGSVLGPGLDKVIGPNLSAIQTLGVLAVVLIAIMALAVAWHRLKAGHRTIAGWIRVVGTASLLLAFVMRRW